MLPTPEQMADAEIRKLATAFPVVQNGAIIGEVVHGWAALHYTPDGEHVTLHDSAAAAADAVRDRQEAGR